MMRKILSTVLMIGATSMACADQLATLSYAWLAGTYARTSYIIPPGSVTPLPGYTLKTNVEATFKAQLPDPGYELVAWSYGVPGTTTQSDGHLPTLVNNTTVGNLTFKHKITFSTPVNSYGIAVHFDWLKYEIAFRANQGSGTMDTRRAISYPTSVTLSNSFTRKGYDFAGWSIGDETTIAFAENAIVTGTSFALRGDSPVRSVTLTAQWSPKTVSLTLDPQGGSVTQATVDATYTQAIPVLPTPTKAGKTFDGWYTEAEYGTQVKEGQTSNFDEAATLYAHWKDVPQMKVVANKLSDEKGADGIVQGTGWYSWEEACTLQATSSTGSRFVGWTKDAETGDYVSTESSYTISVTEGATYYGHFELETYTVTFNYKDEQGQSQTSHQTVKYHQSANPPVEATSGYPDYAFDKWDQNCDSISNDITINAIYKSTALLVYFNANGGQVDEGQKKYNLGDLYGTLPVPTRKGHDAGECWWTDPNYGYPVYSTTEVTTTGTQILYAHWTALNYSVVFDGNGSTSGRMSKQDFMWDEPQALTANAYQKTGYLFLGWARDAQATEAEFTDGQQVENLQKTGTITLYAVWLANTYTVAFNGNTATEGTMTPQSLPVEIATPLKANAFKKAGYSFGGWATSLADAQEKKSTYADQAKVLGLGILGSIIDLYAVWSNNTYTVCFYPNGGVGVPYEQEMTYDIDTTLKANIFTRENHLFLGWTTDPSAATVAYADQETVKSLATDGVVNLFAKWTRNDSVDSDLSRAADCATTVAGERVSLLLSPVASRDSGTIVAETCGEEGTNDSCIKLQSGASGAAFSARIKGRGSFSFYYKVHAEADSVTSFYVELGDGYILEQRQVVDGDWLKVSYMKEDDAEQTIVWRVSKSMTYPGYDDYVLIDNVKWLPEVSDASTVGVTFRLNDGTAAPKDIITNITYSAGVAYGTLPTLAREGFLGWATTKDAGEATVTIGSKVPATDQQLYAVWQGSANPEPTEANRPVIEEGFMFKTDARFDYVIWTTDSLANGGEWKPYGDVITGDGQAVGLPIPPIGDAAGGDAPRYESRFFKVEVIRRGSK